MDRINWCKEQSKGIRLIEPNKNLSEDYFNSAEESMKVLTAIHKIQSNIWLATTFRKRLLGRISERVDLQVYNVLPEKVKKEIDEKGKVLYTALKTER